MKSHSGPFAKRFQKLQGILQNLCTNHLSDLRGTDGPILARMSLVHFF